MLQFSFKNLIFCWHLINERVVFVIYFLFFLFIEVMTSSYFIDMVGGFIFFLEIIGSAFVGIFLLANFKFALSEQIMKMVNRDIDFKDMVSNSIFSLMGGIFLIIPGIFTDVVGILMQFEFFIFVINKLFFKEIIVKSSTKTKNDNQEGEIIDVEVISETKHNSCNNQ